MNSILNKKVFYKNLGVIPYDQAWEYQEKLFTEIIAVKIKNRDLPSIEQGTTPNYLLFCQHPHVYTLGKSGREENLLLNQEELKSKKIDYYKINRGGDITYHGPGQIVCYPILDLDNFFTDIHRYLRLLEETIILSLAELGIESGRMEGLTGVWIGIDSHNPRKICALGVRSSRWVTMHGLALNVNADLKYFNNIIPCGISDKAVTSIKEELGTEVDLGVVEALLKKHLSSLFEMEIIANEL